MAEDERFRCDECGKIFGSRETLEEHYDIEHGVIGGLAPLTGNNFRPLELIGNFRSHLNRSFLYGFLAGILIASMTFGGYTYLESIDRGVPVKVTVVTCDNCSYEKFRTASDRIFNTRYEEVDYRSERGQELIDKYRLNYVPGFIFDEKVAEAENFTRIKNVLVEFDDAYVIGDAGVKVAQRMSTGKSLNRTG